MHQNSLMARMAGALASLIGAPNLSTIGASSLLTDVSAPSGIWPGLRHRGQPPARGILGGPAAMVGSKGMSRRDKHRAIVRASGAGTANHSRDKVAPFERHLDALRAEHAATFRR